MCAPPGEATIGDNAYDRYAYPSRIRPESHPMRLGALARLLGRQAAPFEQCRVLEIGGGDGINLIAMAEAAPRSTFLSFDLAEAPVRRGQLIVDALGFDNVRVRAMDLTQFPGDLGAFDYVIAHGVYAWVPAPVRVALLQLVARVLSPQGVAFISYNTMPAGHVRRALRELMLPAVRHITDPQRKVLAAKALLRSHIERWSPDKPMQAAMRHQAEVLLKKDDAVTFHDELGDVFEPQLVSEVIAAAKAEGLAYLCDAQWMLAAEAIAPGKASADAAPMAGGSFEDFEQFRDFVDMRAFRQSLFCRTGPAIERRADSARLDGLWLSAELTHRTEMRDGKPGHVFQTPKGAQAATDHAELAKLLKAAGDAYPAAVPLHDSIADAGLAAQLVELAAGGLVAVTTSPMPFLTTPPARPRVHALARHLLEQGQPDIPTLRHQVVQFDDEATRSFIGMMDGTRTAAQIAHEMASATGAPFAAAKEQAKEGIRSMTRIGLLVA